MAIKTSSQGVIPQVDLNYLQYSEFNMRVAETAPNGIAISAKIRPYGIVGGEKFYDKNILPMSIPDLDTYIGSIDSSRQAEAMQAMADVQKGLGILASIYLNVDFIGVE